MSRYSAISVEVAQVSPLAAQHLAQHLVRFLTPLLRTLDQQLDVRLVRTFLATIIAIIHWRNRPHGLLLSDLGAYLLTPAQAPAGTKRLSNLLHSPKWKAALLAPFGIYQFKADFDAAPRPTCVSSRVKAYYHCTI